MIERQVMGEPKLVRVVSSKDEAEGIVLHDHRFLVYQKWGTVYRILELM